MLQSYGYDDRDRDRGSTFRWGCRNHYRREDLRFYATMGGQQGDKGQIRTADGVFQVEDTVKLLGGKYGHIGHMVSGMIHTGEEVELVVDAKLRAKTCANHSATHLLQKALREVLGTHVEQAGSYQDSERTRFDFTHFAARLRKSYRKWKSWSMKRSTRAWKSVPIS